MGVMRATVECWRSSSLRWGDPRGGGGITAAGPVAQGHGRWAGPRHGYRPGRQSSARYAWHGLAWHGIIVDGLGRVTGITPEDN